MKIAFVITRLIVGGAQKHVLDCIEGLNKKGGFEPYLITGPAIGREGNLYSEAAKTGACLIKISSLRREINPLLDPIAFFRLTYLFRKYKFDIVHTHSSKAGIIGRLAARCAGVPRIIHTIHGWGFPVAKSSWYRKILISAERFCARFSDCLISVSERVKQAGLKEGIGRESKYKTIQYGISVPQKSTESKKSNLRQELGIKENSIVGISIIRFVEQKNPTDLIAVFKEVLESKENIHFLIVGDGPLFNYINTEIKKEGLENKVTLTGLRKDREKLLGISDFFILSSLWEGMPIVILEAMAMELPVVAYGVDGVKEVIANGNTGLTVSPKDIKGLVKAIIYLMDHPEEAKKMGRRGKIKVANEFNRKLMLEQTTEVYKKTRKQPSS